MDKRQSLNIIENKKENKGSKICDISNMNKKSCKYCSHQIRGISTEIKGLVQNMTHIKDLIPLIQKPLNKELDFLIIDLRDNRDDGILPKSHIIDLNNMTDDIMNKFISNLTELKYKYHFALLINSYNSMQSYLNNNQVMNTSISGQNKNNTKLIDMSPNKKRIDHNPKQSYSI